MSSSSGDSWRYSGGSSEWSACSWCGQEGSAWRSYDGRTWQSGGAPRSSNWSWSWGTSKIIFKVLKRKIRKRGGWIEEIVDALKKRPELGIQDESGLNKFLSGNDAAGCFDLEAGYLRRRRKQKY